MGKLPKAKKASSNEITPTTPGAIRPGLNSSMTMPNPPMDKRMKETLGSEMNSRKFSSKFFLRRRRVRSRVSRVRVPETVSTTRPSSWGQEVVQVVGDEIHHVQLHRLLGGEGGGLPYRFFQFVLVAAPLLSDAADQGGCVILHFAG